VELVTTLRPDDEQRRSGAILPARDDAGVEALLVEVGVGRRTGVGAEARVVRARTRRGELAHVGEVARGDERLRVELQRQRPADPEAPSACGAHAGQILSAA